MADIRLREGEINILGGLSQIQDTTLVNGIPGLVNIPVWARSLFGSNHTDKINGELMIALVPHIVRTPDYSAENLRGIYAGTDQVVKFNYAPKRAKCRGRFCNRDAQPTTRLPRCSSTSRDHARWLFPACAAPIAAANRECASAV